MAQTSYDLIVIGSGPGGYTGAIRAAQLGLKVAVIEKDKTLGGTCLNVGCIPSKALLESSEHFEQAQHDFKGHGIDLGSVQLNLPQMLARKDKIVKELTGGISFLFKKNKIDWIQGLGALKSATEVLVKKTDGAIENLSTRFVMLATGSVPVELPFMKFNGQTIVSSTEALSLPKVPTHLIVVGAGFIGLELGSVWMRLGAKVTVLEFASKICGPMDNHISGELEKILKRQGMNFELEARVTGAEVLNSSSVRVAYDKGGEKKTVEGDVVLVSVGRRPFSEGVGLDAVGIAKDDKGRVAVNPHYQTNVPNIYAIGDLIAGPMLAHKAEEEGVAVAEILAGKAGHVNYETVPSVIYTWPEVASVGATEEQLKEANIPYNVGKFPFAANARAKALGSTDGLVKVLAHQETDRLLGVHIIGPRASDMLAEAVVAMEFGGSAEDLARSFHAHPTLSEVMREAALAVDKRARQI